MTRVERLAAIQADQLLAGEGDDYPARQRLIYGHTPWLLGEVKRLREALANAKQKHHGVMCGGGRQVGEVISLRLFGGVTETITLTEADRKCICGAAVHNAAIDAALEGE